MLAICPPPVRAAEPAPAAELDALGQLKSRTRAAHDAIEQQLDLLRPGLSAERYRRLLDRFLGFYEPLESQLAKMSALGRIDGLELPTRWKTPWLIADLRALSASAADRVATVRATAAQLPELERKAQALGCLYVLEGASLGGALIHRHLESTLPDVARDAGAFFRGHGDRTGSRWVAFRAVLRRELRRADQIDDAVRAAQATFSSLGRWCAPATDQTAES